jgi:hypothetical protein
MIEKIRHIKTRANAYLDEYALEYRVLVILAILYLFIVS